MNIQVAIGWPLNVFEHVFESGKKIVYSSSMIQLLYEYLGLFIAWHIFYINIYIYISCVSETEEKQIAHTNANIHVFPCNKHVFVLLLTT